MMLQETKDTLSLSEGLLREMGGFEGKGTILRHRTNAYIPSARGKQPESER